MKPRTKNRSRESERLKRKQLLPLKYRYSERRKRVYVAAAIKINRTRHLWPPSCLLLRGRACEKTWVQEKPSTNQTKVSFVRPHAITYTKWSQIISRCVANIFCRFWDHFPVVTFFTFVAIKQCLLLLKYLLYATFHTLKHNRPFYSCVLSYLAVE